MSKMATASIVIDNFLTTDQWNTIQSGITGHLNSSTYTQERDSIHTQILTWIQAKLESLSLWKSSWTSETQLFSELISTPVGVDRESSDPNNGVYHREAGGFIYYIHPAWDSSWGGHLKFKDCDVAQIEPTPNRFVWVNPDVWHGIEVVDAAATTNRVTVVGWPAGTMEYGSADIIINTSV